VVTAAWKTEEGGGLESRSSERPGQDREIPPKPTVNRSQMESEPFFMY
jgi:hypothetical protein